MTVNIFSAYCMRNLTDNPGSWAWTTTEITVMQEAISKISSGATTYDGMGYSLAFWLQLADGFGWDTMKNVFRDYELDNINNTAALPTNTQEEYDQWLIRYSSMVGHDLRQWMVDYWKLQVSADALTTVASLDLPTWMPAMGGIDSFTVKYNKNITFDLRGEALSLDGTAFVSSVGQGSNGNVVDLGGGSYTYEPSSNHVELDSFDYTVTSSSGHGHVTTVQVTVTAVPDGAVETIFADHNNWSGNYFPSSTDSIGDRPVWDLNGSTASDSIMIFFCSGSKYWVLTSSQWRQALIDGGGCGGFAKTAQGTGAEEFWESTWDREVVFDFPPDGL